MRNCTSIFLIVIAAILLLAALPAPAAESSGEDPLRFNYFVNDWNVVGLKDYERGARMTPDNHIMLAGKNTVVRVRYGRRLKPLAHEQHQDAHGRLDAHHGDRRGRRAGALRVHLLGDAACPT